MNCLQKWKLEFDWELKNVNSKLQLFFIIILKNQQIYTEKSLHFIYNGTSSLLGELYDLRYTKIENYTKFNTFK